MAGVGYMSYLAFCPEGRPKPNGRCNSSVRLNEPKVVDSIDIEDIADKAAFCRCWKSKNVNFNGFRLDYFIFLNFSFVILVALL